MRNLSVLKGHVVAAAATVLLAGAVAASASTITVPNGTGGGTCGAGNANLYRFGGNCGSKVQVNTTDPAYVQDNSPAAEGTYRVRFYINLAGRAPVVPPVAADDSLLTMTTGDQFDIFAAYDGADPVPPATAGDKELRVQVDFVSAGNYTVQAFIRTDAGTELSTSTKAVKRGWAAVEVEWAKSTAVGANNGKLNLWVNGSAATTQVTGVDNDTAAINYVRWGALPKAAAATLPATLSGVFKLDDFVSQRENYIGPAQPFSDNTNTSSSFWPFIQSTWANEIMPGCTSSTFCPANNIRRDEMAKYIVSSRLGTAFTPSACVTPQFADVPCSNAYEPYIRTLVNAGVVTGCGGGNYCPSATVTRREMIVFVLASLIGPPTTCNGTFADVQPAGPHASFCPWIETAATAGVVSGCGGGNFCPLNITRKDEMSVFLGQTFGLPLHVVGP